mgnify:CR=1 FL=1|tara:strand:+ start:1068 stop:1283 length:216 start_codon:yes stop_codon:yes gene_type:complete
MWNRIIKFLSNKFWESLPVVIVLFVVYLMIATFTFSVRHPWATDMEKFIHVGDALMFNKISYKEMRGEYEK